MCDNSFRVLKQYSCYTFSCVRLYPYVSMTCKECSWAKVTFVFPLHLTIVFFIYSVLLFRGSWTLALCPLRPTVSHSCVLRKTLSSLSTGCWTPLYCTSCGGQVETRLRGESTKAARKCHFQGLSFCFWQVNRLLILLTTETPVLWLFCLVSMVRDAAVSIRWPSALVCCTISNPFSLFLVVGLQAH